MSFIVPVYNNSIKELERCIRSIKKIWKINYEIIIVNNGSKKNKTFEYTKLLDKINDDSICYIYTKKKGVSNARNIGMRYSSGTFVTFVDADDIIIPDFYNNLNINDDVDLLILDAIIKNTHSSKIIQFECQNPNNVTMQELIWNLTSSYRLNNVWGKLFRLSFIKRNNIIFNSELQLGEDVTFLSNVIIKSPITKYISKVSYIYYQGVKNSTNRVITSPLKTYENTKYLFNLKKSLLGKLDNYNSQLDYHVTQEYIKGMADTLFELWHFHNEQVELIKKRIFNDFEKINLNSHFSVKTNIIIFIIKNKKYNYINCYVFLKKKYLSIFKR